MVRSNPQAKGYAVPTYSTTQITARETFGGPAKAGLGRHIGMGNWTYGAIVNGSSGHSAPQFAGPNYYPAFLAGRVSTLYPVSSTNQLGNISGSLANSQFGPSSDGWGQTSSMWQAQQRSMTLWNTVGRNMRPVRTVPNGCLNGIPARDGTCRVEYHGNYIFHYYVYGPNGSYKNNFMYYGGKQELLLFAGWMHGPQPDLDAGAADPNHPWGDTPMITAFEMIGDDGSKIIVIISAHHPTDGLVRVAHVVTTDSNGKRQVQSGHVKKSGVRAKLSEIDDHLKSGYTAAKTALEDGAHDVVEGIEHPIRTAVKVAKLIKKTVVATGEAVLHAPAEALHAAKKLVAKAVTVTKNTVDDAVHAVKDVVHVVTHPVASVTAAVDDLKNKAKDALRSADEKLKSHFHLRL